MKIKTIAINAIIAALYVAITAVIQPFAFLTTQFRIPEMFNHLIVFNKKYFYGIVIGVFLANLFFSPLLPLDLYYGVGHSIISMAITLVLIYFVKNIWLRMIINTLVFSSMMFIIAYQIKIAYGLPFWETYLSVGILEFLVMIIGMPLIYIINKRINLKNL